MGERFYAIATAASDTTLSDSMRLESFKYEVGKLFLLSKEDSRRIGKPVIPLILC